MKIIKQSTYETCLPCCLLMMSNKGNKDEIKIWKQGWRFNYLIGQLNYVARKYGKAIKAYIQNQKEDGVELVNKKITIALIDELLVKGNVIIYIDNYYLQGILHAPHFVMALRRIEKIIEIVDPFDGKLKKIPADTIQKGIISLRNHLKYSPVLITFPQTKKKAL